MLSPDTFEYILTGALFGLTAGISPGPLLALVISETVKYGTTSGMKVAAAPLLSDLPIVLLSFVLFSEIAHLNYIMGVISFIGAMFLVYLGVECFRSGEMKTDGRNTNAGSLRKGLLVNLLNPHPYLFWVTVGTPMALKAFHESFLTSACYFLSFYISLIGSKITLAIIVGRSRNIMTNKIYAWILKVLGFALFGFSLILLFEGIKHFSLKN